MIVNENYLPPSLEHLVWGGGYDRYNKRGYIGSLINIRYYVSSSLYVNTSTYILSYDSNYLYIADNNDTSAADGKIFKIYVDYIINGIYPRTLIEYDESDNITWENCRVTDNNLIDSLIDMQPACWQQYIDRDGKNFAVFAFPLK